MRTGRHETYDRIVFDWPSRVRFTVSEQPGLATVQFESPGRVDNGAVREALPPQLRGFESDSTEQGLRVTIPVPEGGRLVAFTSGPKVVLDVRRTGGETTAQATPQPAPQPAPQSAQQPASQGTASAATETESQAATAAASSASPTETTPNPALAPTENAATAQATEAQAPAGDASQTHPATPSLAPTPNLAQAPASPSTAAIPPPLSVEEEPATAAASEAPSEAAASVPQTTGQAGVVADGSLTPPPDALDLNITRVSDDITGVIAGQIISVSGTRNNDVVSLRFDWPDAVGAVAFTRAGYLWVGFDRPARFDTGGIDASATEIAGRAEQVPVSSGSLFRIPIVSGIGARVWRDGEAWEFDLQPRTARPDVALRVDAQMVSPQGPRLFIPVEEVGQTILVQDPEVGDRLFLVPVKPLSRGIDGDRDYIESSLLSSVQGVVVRPKVGDIQIRLLPDGSLSRVRAACCCPEPHPARLMTVSPEHGLTALPEVCRPGGYSI